MNFRKTFSIFTIVISAFFINMQGAAFFSRISQFSRASLSVFIKNSKAKLNTCINAHRLKNTSKYPWMAAGIWWKNEKDHTPSGSERAQEIQPKTHIPFIIVGPQETDYRGTNAIFKLMSWAAKYREGICSLEGNIPKWWNRFTRANLQFNHIHNMEEALLYNRYGGKDLPPQIKQLALQIYADRYSSWQGIKDAAVRHTSDPQGYGTSELTHNNDLSSDVRQVTEEELTRISQNADTLKSANFFVNSEFQDVVENPQAMKRLGLTPGTIRCKRGVVCVIGKKPNNKK